VINKSGRFQLVDEEEKSQHEDEFNPFMLKSGPSRSMVTKTKEQRQAMETLDGKDNLANFLKAEVGRQPLLASHVAKMMQIQRQVMIAESKESRDP
jgi:hypothetical protein